METLVEPDLHSRGGSAIRVVAGSEGGDSSGGARARGLVPIAPVLREIIDVENIIIVILRLL